MQRIQTEFENYHKKSTTKLNICIFSSQSIVLFGKYHNDRD